MKENKRLTVGDSTTDSDFETKPGPYKKACFVKSLKEKQMSDLEKGPIMPNTEKSAAWALRTFTDWHYERNTCSAVHAKCPLDLLENPDAKKLNYWLSCFIMEARHKDSEPYPASTLYLLLACLLHYGRSKSKFCPNFMDKNDSRFELSGTCDSVAQQLCKDGVGATHSHCHSK